METVNTICHMCEVVCGMRAYVESGRLVKVEGIPNHVASHGGLCSKGLCAVEYEYDPKRLTTPLERTGERDEGKWQEISWDRALGIISGKLKEFKERFGAESVVWYRGSGPGWGSNWSYVKRFMSVFGSPNIASHDHLCYTPRAIATGCTYGFYPAPDYENANLIVLWGYNPGDTHIPDVARRILDAIERGARLLVIDPRFNNLASKAHLFVQPRPGTDGALALGILNYIVQEGLYNKEFIRKWVHGFDKFSDFIQEYPLEKVSEITWVPIRTIKQAANMCATIHPAVIQSENGIEQHTNVVQTMRAIAILQAITGNIDVLGGNIYLPHIGTRDLRLKEKLKETLKEVESVSKHPLYYGWWGVSTPEVLDAIETGKPYHIKAMIVQGGAIVTVSSNSMKVKKILNKVDFIVVHEQYMTATAMMADLVLPAATFLEHTHIRTESDSIPNVNTQVVALADKVVEPLGDCWSDPKFIFELARRLGYEEYFPWRDDEEAINYELEPLGLTVQKLRENPEGIAIMYSSSKMYRTYEKNGFKTPTGKVEFYSENFAKYGYDPLPLFKEPAESPYSRPDLYEEYPLICNTGLKLTQFTHTRFRTLRSLNRIHPDPFVEIHPHTASRLDINEGDWVFVESARGRIRVKAKPTLRVHPRVVFVTHGWGQPYAHGENVNILTDDEPRCPISAATGNRSVLCKVYKE
jgi:anaerobic selenocysteine-containing dehydrogenase